MCGKERASWRSPCLETEGDTMPEEGRKLVQRIVVRGVRRCLCGTYPDQFLWTCSPDELERSPRKSSSASSAALPSHFYADGPCSFSEVGATGRRSHWWEIHLRGSLRGQSTGLFLLRRCMSVLCCFLARYANVGRNKFNTTNRNKYE